MPADALGKTLRRIVAVRHEQYELARKRLIDANVADDHLGGVADDPRLRTALADYVDAAEKYIAALESAVPS